MMPRSLLAAIVATGALAGSPRASAQSFTVQPYLQDATAERVVIRWEATTSEGTVSWGSTPDASLTAPSESTEGPAGWRHRVALTGLSPGTRYHYRVHAGAERSDAFDFITPPAAGAATSFRLLALSDMQRDAAHPQRFFDVVHGGVLPYLAAEDGHDDLATSLALGLVPGDLVEDGHVHRQWVEEFFAPSAALWSHVPLYPVPGNHENDSPLFFEAFELPANGTPGFEEHWWHRTHGNVLLIGLDTNEGYRLDEQLAWLDELLAATCTRTDVDFAVAELHHPHLSELWLDGEVDYTGGIVARLERFSTDCGKPSVHLFGHAHGYSRGQSRDHDHLWVNVATAGGSIDEWGEFAQTDHDVFTVTQPDYGFVLLDVEPGDDPELRLRRISRGDLTTPRDNEIRDEITVRLHNVAPDTPVALSSPGAGDRLAASAFLDPDGDLHGASHWQLDAACDFQAPAADLWHQHENLYFGVDTQAGDDLTDTHVPALPPGRYCWRVRYRDRSLGWSDWSAPASVDVDEVYLGGAGVGCSTGPAPAGSPFWLAALALATLAAVHRSPRSPPRA